jgi:hypothetical protein
MQMHNCLHMIMSSLVAFVIGDVQLARAKQVNEQNKNSRCQKNQEFERDKQFEADCMALTAAREAAETLQEKELKDAQKREARQYADHLKAVMGRLNADESARNAQYKAEEDAEWAKREAGWKREEDLRKRLWNRVHEERQQQLMEKGMFDLQLMIKIFF